MVPEAGDQEIARCLKPSISQVPDRRLESGVRVTDWFKDQLLERCVVPIRRSRWFEVVGNVWMYQGL
jgi:hypothetical protein